MAAGAGITDNQLKRWCLVYWCYYHAGVSSIITERSTSIVHPRDFYDEMRKGISEGWPRGMERRYFYGDLAWNTVEKLEEFGSPESVVDAMTDHQDFQTADKAIQSFYGFGSWIAWKVADMADRVLQIDIDFSDTNLDMYKDPKQGAAYIYSGGNKKFPITEDQLDWVVQRMESYYNKENLLAPPFQDRPINIQEVETVLCKYKAHCYGFYPYGNDTVHVAKALDGWGDLAQSMLSVLKKFTVYKELRYD
jgi:hypothetical protein